MDTAAKALCVGIVGAGPVGLTLAARLATLGVRSVVLDKSPHLLRKGSKACLIQGDVLEILDKIGCADPISTEGIHWRVAHTYIRDVEMITQQYPERVGFGQFVNISQFRIEQELLAFAESCDLIEVNWHHNVTAVEQYDEHVTVTVTTPEDERSLNFSYLVACDGVRSTLRDITGVKFTGYTHQDRFLITDIRANIPLTKERHFFFDSRFNPGRQLVMHPQPDNIWRIDWQLAPDADIEQEKSDGTLDARIRRVVGDIPYQIQWLSTYRFNQRVVERFKVGRIFFAGDAAHSLPPYGSRGMNSGIQDADNLAWKLAYVLSGKASERLLESYHDERYPAALENLRVTEATMMFMVPPNRWQRFRRQVIFRLAVPFKSLRGLVDHGKMAEPFVYKEGALYAKVAAHPLVGQFVPDASIYFGDDRSRLRKLFGEGFVCLFFGSPAETSEFMAHAESLHLPVPIKYVLTHAKGDTAPDAHSAATVAAYDDILFYRKFYTGEPAWYLIRPDGHVATCGGIGEINTLGEAVLRSVGHLPAATS